MVHKFNTFIFNHIPKCGGTSFRALLNESSLAMDILPSEIYIPGFNGLAEDKNIDQISIREQAILRRKKISIFASHSRFDVHNKYKLRFKQPFYFTILRNPLDRFFSHYNFFYKKLGYMDCKGVDLNNLPEDKLKFLLEDLSNIHIKYLSNYRSRDIYIVKWENMFRVAKYNLQYEYHAYGILEEMDKMIPHINGVLPKWLKLKEVLPNLNTQKKKHAKEEINPKIVERILEYNELDIKLYDFAKNYFKFKHENLEMLAKVKDNYGVIL